MRIAQYVTGGLALSALRSHTLERGSSGFLRFSSLALPAIPNVPNLDVAATADSTRRDLTLFVVNRDWRHPISAMVVLKGFEPTGRATVRTLNADSILAENNEEYPDAVHPVKSSLNLDGHSLHYTFPEHSLTVLSFERTAARSTPLRR